MLIKSASSPHQNNKRNLRGAVVVAGLSDKTAGGLQSFPIWHREGSVGEPAAGQATVTGGPPGRGLPHSRTRGTHSLRHVGRGDTENSLTRGPEGRVHNGRGKAGDQAMSPFLGLP